MTGLHFLFLSLEAGGGAGRTVSYGDSDGGNDSDDNDDSSDDSDNSDDDIDVKIMMRITGRCAELHSQKKKQRKALSTQINTNQRKSTQIKTKIMVSAATCVYVFPCLPCPVC